jgi:peptidoglycan/LPS O-acetylase OafA/YrhL
MLYNVQAGRALAALMVVYLHVTAMISERFGGMDWFYPGAAGVDIFFAISGFLMVMTTAGQWGQPGVWRSFIVRRIIRIVPLYWLMTAAKLAQMLVIPALAQRSTLVPWHVVASFLFIPAWNAEHEAIPLIPLGWTLSFEMLFYVLFAAALALRLRPVPWLTAVLVAGAAIGLFRTDGWGAEARLLDPLLLEFVFGMGIAMAALRGRYLPVPVALVGAPAMFLVLVATNWLDPGWANGHRALVWGVPGAILLACLVALEGRWRGRLFRLACFLGDASYAIYLAHGFVLSIVGVLFTRLVGPRFDLSGWLLLPTFVLAVAGGVIVHLLIERPVTDWLRRRWHERRLRRAVSA